MSDFTNLNRLADLLRLFEHTVLILARRRADPSQELEIALAAIGEALVALDAASERGLIAASESKGALPRAH